MNWIEDMIFRNKARKVWDDCVAKELKEMYIKAEKEDWHSWTIQDARLRITKESWRDFLFGFKIY